MNENIFRQIKNRLKLECYLMNNEWLRDCIEFYMNQHKNVNINFNFRNIKFKLYIFLFYYNQILFSVNHGRNITICKRTMAT